MKYRYEKLSAIFLLVGFFIAGPFLTEQIANSQIEGIENLKGLCDFLENNNQDVYYEICTTIEPLCDVIIVTDKKSYTQNDTIKITVTNNGPNPVDFPNGALGMEIINEDTGEKYPLISIQVITTLNSSESKEFEYAAQDLESEIGLGSIVIKIDYQDCDASTSFALQ